MKLTSWGPTQHWRAVSSLAWLMAAASGVPAHAQSQWLQNCGLREGNQGSYCVENFSEGLAAVQVGSASEQWGRWGYIDKSGRMAIQPAYIDTREFSNGLAAVQSGELWGYIDKQGAWVLTPRFKEAGNFNAQGTALAENDGRTLLINRQGEVLKTFGPEVSPHYYHAFRRGALLTEMKVGQPDVMWNARSGEALVLPSTVSKLEPPQDGLFPAWERKARYTGSWGFLDSRMQWVATPAALDAADVPLHHRGVFAVKRKVGTGADVREEWRFVDAAGKSLSSRAYRDVSVLLPGVWSVEHADGSYGLLNDKLQLLRELDRTAYLNNRQNVFGNGLWLTTGKELLLMGAEGRIKAFPALKPSAESRYGFLWLYEALPPGARTNDIHDDKRLAQVITLQGEGLLDEATRKQLQAYSVTAVSRDEKHETELASRLPLATLRPYDGQQPNGILTASGKVVINPQWDEFEGDNETQAPLVVKTREGLYGAIDGHGGWVVPPKFAGIRGFAGGYAWARPPEMARGQAVLIDAGGNVKPVPKRIEENSSDDGITEGLLPYHTDVNGSQRWGWWDIVAGRTLTPTEFDRIEAFQQGLAPAVKDEKWGVLNRAGQWAIEPRYAGHSDVLKRLDDKLFVMSGEGRKRPGESYPDRIYRLVSAASGQELTGDLREVPVLVAPERYLVAPVGGGVALMDAQGKTLAADGRTTESQKAHEGWIKLAYADRHGVIDSQGNWRIEPRYLSIEHLAEPEGLARVTTDHQAGSWLTDLQGKELMQGLERPEPLAGMGLIQVGDSEKDATVLLDLQGREVARLAYKYAIESHSASEGLAVYQAHVGEGEGDPEMKFGFIDAQGKRVIGPRFDYLQPMHNGRALARQKAKSGKSFGYIDRTGRFVIPPQFEGGLNFQDERALVVRKGVTQFIDSGGGVVVSFHQQCDQVVLRDGKGQQTWPLQPLNCGKAKGRSAAKPHH